MHTQKAQGKLESIYYRYFKKILHHWLQMMLLKVKILPEHQGANMGTPTSSAQVQNNQMFL